MNQAKSYLSDALKSSLAYGLGLGLGIIITGLLYAMADIIRIGLRLPPQLLFIGLGIALLIEAIGSGIGGAISESVSFSGIPQEASMAANRMGQIAVGWVQDLGEGGSEIYWLPREWLDDGASWQSPIRTTEGSGGAQAPQMVIDSSGGSHIIWEDEGTILYNQCQDDACVESVIISETVACSQATNHTAPSLTIDDVDNLMVVWQAGDGQLLYRLLPASGEFSDNPVDCVPVGGAGMAHQPQVDGGNDGRFALTYIVGEASTGAIHTTSFVDGQWQSSSAAMGNGKRPNIFLDEEDVIHLAWCSEEDEVSYVGSEESQIISSFSCGSRPEIAQDSQGILHIIWFGDSVVDVNGRAQPQTLVYESARVNSSWSEPAIIGRTGTTTQPSIASTQMNLHLAWHNTLNGEDDITYASFVPYSCEDYPLGGYQPGCIRRCPPP